MNKKMLFYGIVIAQVAFLLLMIAFKQSTLAFGERVLLKPVPVDPTDPFRGDYVTFRYDISTIELSPDQKPDFVVGQRVYVGLKKVAEYWGVAGVSGKPVGDLYLKGTVRSIQQKILYTIREENGSGEYAYSGYDYGEGYPQGQLRGGQKVEFTLSNGQVMYANPCDNGCPSAQGPRPKEAWEPDYRTGTITAVTPGITEMSIDYPINTYFVPKGQGTRDELREFGRLLIEVAVWKGDAVVTGILYDGKAIDFSVS
ncbi:GDYXXLXY domain-containing protein, partial [Candidatus Woesearchaeota archaeon]|nr:GDYXXLXY domain-containing protein [Candidatus Woesearchaeota archaeon]